MGQKLNAKRRLLGKPARKRPPGRPRHRWEDNITFVLQEAGKNPGRQVAVANKFYMVSVFVDSQYDSCFVSSIWHLEFCDDQRFLEKLCTPVLKK